jgi:hypothetical protein
VVYLGLILVYLLFQSDYKVFWETVALCDPQYSIPFLVLISFVKGEVEYPFDVVSIGC